MFGGSSLPLSFFSPVPPGRPNFGDALNAVLIPAFTGRPVHCVPFDDPGGLAYLAIGSTLQLVTRHHVVWGAGFIAPGVSLRESPAAVAAVRGPLSRQKMLQQGVDCPPVFGDPAILLPWLWSFRPAKRWRIGVVPHYVDQGHPLLASLRARSDVCMIDIQAPWKKVLRRILACDHIFASSLHALIVADAYGIPCLRFVATDRVIGGNFKFIDYRLGVGGSVFSTLALRDLAADPLAALSRCSTACTLDAAMALMRACPF